MSVPQTLSEISKIRWTWSTRTRMQLQLADHCPACFLSDAAPLGNYGRQSGWLVFVLECSSPQRRKFQHSNTTTSTQRISSYVSKTFGDRPAHETQYIIDTFIRPFLSPPPFSIFHWCLVSSFIKHLTKLYFHLGFGQLSFLVSHRMATLCGRRSTRSRASYSR